ncbi:hypothetical protein PspLS_04550 [Pyricularia sp. CBS 133598]|nr:hypothetical protein PspLS_04550 [Pyricularia sp. CBS 133598]
MPLGASLVKSGCRQVRYLTQENEPFLSELRYVIYEDSDFPVCCHTGLFFLFPDFDVF